MSLRSRSHVKSSMVLTKVDHLCIQNYIGSLQNIIVRPIFIFRNRLEPAGSCVQLFACLTP